ncbi:MAG: carboxypeptidase regulatory-like domain-containing protein [Candidatus Kuenenia sp.]|nr:carboxypeptidase regulatory-like domain-containing protein [Candidatus Kuenenia hertensis]
MMKSYVMVLFLSVCFSSVTSGDVIVLKDFNKEIDFRVLGATDEYVSVEIPKRDMKSLKMQFSQNDYFSDVIFLDKEEITLECKVKEIKKDEIIILIPAFAISSIQMSFKENGELVTDEKMYSSNMPEVHSKNGEKDRIREYKTQNQRNDMQKEGSGEIADELRTDISGGLNSKKHYKFKTKKVFKEENVGAEAGDRFDKNEFADFRASDDTEATRMLEEKTFRINENKEDILGNEEVFDTAEALVEEATTLQDPNLGIVEGRILKSGKPIKDCLVQLRRLEKSGLLLKEYRLVEGALELETVTNDEGYYHFMNVSPGEYKLYWKSLEETTWVRRFKMEPDVIVESGKTVKPRDIEILKRTLN